MLVGPDEAWRLDPQLGRFEGVRALDGAWLETALSDVAARVSYQHGLSEVLAELDAGRAGAGVLIRPVSVPEIERPRHAKLVDATEIDLLHPQAQDRFRHSPTRVSRRFGEVSGRTGPSPSGSG